MSITLRISGAQHRELADALNGGRAFESQADLLAAVERQGRAFATDRRLRDLEAAEQDRERRERHNRVERRALELERAEEAEYEADFQRRFGHASPFVPSADAAEAERREIAGRLQIPIDQVR